MPGTKPLGMPIRLTIRTPYIKDRTKGFEGVKKGAVAWETSAIAMQ